MLAEIKKNSLSIFLGFLSLVYLLGVTSYKHTSMGRWDMYMGLVLTLLLAIGLLIWYSSNSIKKIGISTVTWLLMLLVFILQPLLNHITYLDSLIFPIGIMLVLSLIHI